MPYPGDAPWPTQRGVSPSGLSSALALKRNEHRRPLPTPQSAHHRRNDPQRHPTVPSRAQYRFSTWLMIAESRTETVCLLEVTRVSRDSGAVMAISTRLITGGLTTVSGFPSPYDQPKTDAALGDAPWFARRPGASRSVRRSLSSLAMEWYGQAASTDRDVTTQRAFFSTSTH